jgi:DNA primase
MFHCFACNEVHTLPEVVSHCFGKHEDLSGSWGWKWLLKNFAVVQVEERKDVELDFDRTFGKTRSGNASGITGISYISEEELDSYRYIHPYMYKRRLTDEIIELFDIGYDKLTKCITFPVRDRDGNCLFIARRSVVTKFFNYPEGVAKPVYGIYELYKTGREHEDLIICESMLDALTAWVYGRTAVALNGLGNELQFKQLQSLPCRKMILGTDNDAAGKQARTRIRKNLHGKILTEYVFPDGKKDLNDLEIQEFEQLEEVF